MIFGQEEADRHQCAPTDGQRPWGSAPPATGSGPAAGNVIWSVVPCPGAEVIWRVSQSLQALLDAEKTEAPRPCLAHHVLDSKPYPVVAEEAVHALVILPQLEVDVGGGGMFGDVGQALLHDAIESRFAAGASRPASALSTRMHSFVRSATLCTKLWRAGRSPKSSRIVGRSSWARPRSWVSMASRWLRTWWKPSRNAAAAR